jgi:quercetin dioxygenase-like cupin family protein
MLQLRRVVTGVRDGKSTVLFDGPPTNVVPGRVADLWCTQESPVELGGDGDAALRPIVMEPPPGGTIFRYIQVDPETSTADAQATVKAIEAVQAAHTRVDTSRHPAMHVTNTIDYIVVLAGSVTMLLDEGEVELRQFDTVVQRGANHAWVNRGTEPCILLAAQVSAAARHP